MEASLETRVKICGVTNLEDANLAVELGAWAIGLNFYAGSPRRCDGDVAATVGQALKRRPSEVAGIFVNEELDRLVAIADECDLTLLQLHGDEGPAYCDEAARRTGARVIKAVQVKGVETVRGLGAHRVDYFLLDGYQRELRGGTGQTFDWRVLRGEDVNAPVILSGGLTPSNVAAAIAEVKPFAVDVASGIEFEGQPGRKDPELLRAFFEATRSATVEA